MNKHDRSELSVAISATAVLLGVVLVWVAVVKGL